MREHPSLPLEGYVLAYASTEAPSPRGRHFVSLPLEGDVLAYASTEAFPLRGRWHPKGDE